MNSPASASDKWYSGVTRYQWLVLVVASLGWVFDAFEGQLYNLTRFDMLPDLLGVANLPASPSTDVGEAASGSNAAVLSRAEADALVKRWGEILLGIFLAGGTLGGWLFSWMADRWGRKPIMALTILFYSIFSGLTAFATDIWQVGALRFLVAMGVGGEWAVGAALVAEVFPAKARERASGIFHATSVAGLWLAAAAGYAVGSHWRWAYLIGIVPALLVLWVRVAIREPDSWQEAKQEKAERLGSIRELLGVSRWRTNAIFGALLAMTGLATFWGVVVAGQDIANELFKKLGDANASQNAKLAYGFVQNFGAGLGMLAFGPLSAWLGRKPTFVLMHLAALVVTPLLCWLPLHFESRLLLFILMPIFGFFTLGIHAGYAVYFPELFPTHLRATGAGFCFNTGRILAAPVLIWLSASMKAAYPLPMAISLLGGFFLLGILFLLGLPETKGQPLPE
jgi:MFS family permease